MNVYSNIFHISPKRFKTRALVLAISAHAAALAQADTATTTAMDNSNTTGIITVFGQAASIKGALDVQQNANNVKSVVHSDDIGQLPDNNAAEALQRVPGVSVERDQGEGRYVRVRGLAPELNAVTINGSLVPSPESGTRAVMLDVVPSDMVQSLEVIKTLTPDMDANSLGGTIAVKTLTGFDHEGLFATAEVAGSQDENTGENSPKLAGAISNRFLDDTLAIAGGLNWEERDFGSDNVETGGAWNNDGLAELERRDYLITRERLGSAFNIDYRPEEGHSYYAHTMFSQFTDSEIRQGHKVEFDSEQLPGVQGDAEASRQLKDREEKEQILSVVLGTEHTFGDWKLESALGHGKSHEDTPYHIAGATFEGNTTFSNTGFNNSKKPALFGPALLNDASIYELDEVEMEEQFTEDTENNLKLDLTRHFELANATGMDLKFGAKVSRRDKDSDTEVFKFGGGGESMSDFVTGQVDYSMGNFGPGISSSAIKNWLAGQDKLAAYEDVDSIVEDFSISEDIDAAYVQSAFTTGPWWILAGVRMENTGFSASGTSYDDDTDTFSPIKAKNDYTHWLPGVHMRYDLNNDNAIRAAWTNTVVRPTFEQLRPGFSREGTAGDYEAEVGNPELDAMESSNLDVGYEYRIGDASLLSAYLFHKDITNFVYGADLAGSGDWVDYSEAIGFANGDDASVTGLELAWSQQFGDFLVAGNITASDSDATIKQGGLSREVSLPSQSDLTANLTLGYEIRQVSLRLATNYKSDYLLTLGEDTMDKSQDIHVDEQTQVDFSASYNVLKQLQLSFDVLNLTDEPYYTYQGSSKYNAQYEEYGQTYRLGIKYTNL